MVVFPEDRCVFGNFYNGAMEHSPSALRSAYRLRMVLYAADGITELAYYCDNHFMEAFIAGVKAHE